MRATVLDIYLAMADSLATALQCDVIDGFPTWARPEVAPPIAAMEAADGPIVARTRVGGGPDAMAMGWKLYLFGSDEVDLLTLIDRLASWLEQSRVFGVNDSRVAATILAAERYDAETLAQQEQHAWVASLSTQW